MKDEKCDTRRRNGFLRMRRINAMWPEDTARKTGKCSEILGFLPTNWGKLLACASTAPLSLQFTFLNV